MVYLFTFEFMADVALAIRILVGLIFLPSALGKLANRDQFNQAVLDYAILPTRGAYVYGMLLPWIELTLSLALFAGIATRLIALAASLLLVSFIVAVVTNLKRGRVLGCHCYGVLDSGMISWGTVARNVVLLILTIILLVISPEALSLSTWLSNWRHDSLIVISDSVLPLGLLIAFGFVTLRLIEGGVSLGYRFSQLRFPVDNSSGVKIYTFDEGYAPCTTDSEENTSSTRLVTETW